MANFQEKIGEPLSDGLFSAFFALHVIPLRANLFPNIHEEIEERRKRPRKEKLNLWQRKKRGKRSQGERKENEANIGGRGCLRSCPKFGQGGQGKGY